MFINKKYYEVNDYEYKKINHLEFTNLKLHNELDIHERIIGFIQKLKELYFSKNKLISVNTSHGAFMPINLSNHFDKIYLVNTNNSHAQNIETNISKHKIKNFFDYNRAINNALLPDELNIILNLNNDNIHQYIFLDNTIVISKNIDKNINLNHSIFMCYKFKNVNLYVYVSHNLVTKFESIFKYFIEENQNQNNHDSYDKIITYDNLINLCIMVKNAGPQFRDMLKDNLNIIDKWTILDTGSTDETINIIQDVLVGKKEGHLYQEPFINFRDSRNRLLDLAGNDCKFIIMLDDTYIVNGDLRKFLNEVRSDQYSNTFTLMIRSDDTKYGSNRVIKSDTGLRYIHKIHEVISDKNNINVVIPEERTFINDRRFDYMEKRTMERKQLDLKLLFEELEEDPYDPRAYYYLAQTYNLLEDYEKAYYFFMKRCEFINAGFLQERVDAAFEAARVANFKLNKPWEECEKLYLKAFKIDESRPESLYFIGIHYYLENQYTTAYEYFKKGFEIGFPEHCQYSLKPTLSFHFLPKFLSKICYYNEDYVLGLKASEFFLLHNQQNADDYPEILSWHHIFKKLTLYTGEKIISSSNSLNEPICCFVADGGFHHWTGSNINVTGVGGSETYIIEMARYIKKHGYFGTVIVFCNTPQEQEEIFEGVIYRHLNEYYKFINTTYVHTCIISRFSEYIPLTIKGFSENIYFVIHDLTPSGIVIPVDIKLKNIFCLTEWHVSYFTNIFSILQNITVPFYYGIDDTNFQINNTENDSTSYKIKHKFIYSSFPNRGLLELLQMWPKIHAKTQSATLYIYSNVNNEWSNKVEPEKMKLIKDLLNDYANKNIGIHYKSWVSKKELAESWKTADIWFYPCTFQETFCLTALEAAASKTFAVTNGLAALQNTVSNRGYIIEGDATTEEWQNRALEVLFKYMSDDPEIVSKKEMLVLENYKWSKTLSWKSQANKLLHEYLIPNGLYEYKGMYNWTNNVPDGSIKVFKDILNKFVSSYWKFQIPKQIKVLEVGTYSGTSLIEMIKYIPNSLGTALDLWKNYDENKLLSNMDNLKIKESFYKNIKTAGLENRIRGIQTDSKKALIQFIKDREKFDIIFIDASHLLLDCYTDIVLSWEILEKGGYLIIDDYLYKKDKILKSPFEAVNHFFNIYKEQYNILYIGYRVFLEKTI